MKQDRTESFASPLDEVLDNIPQEDAPDGLEQRCLDALGSPTAEIKPSHPNWWLPVRNVIAVAAGLVLVVGAISMVGPRMIPMEEAPTDQVESVQMAPPPLSAPRTDSVAPAESMAESAAEPGNASGGRFAAGVEMDEAEGRAWQMAADEAAPEAPTRQISSYGGELTHAEIAPRGDAADVIAQPQSVPAAAPQAPEVEDPWRDFSGDRQVVTTKELDMEVRDVEGAYDSARSIVEKHGGFIASDRVQIAEDQPDVAHLTIRVPVANFESTITDLRQLGEVMRLVGQSVDVTEQYYGQGADVREKADREQWLIDRMDNARTERERQQLKHQIEQLRREMEQEKAILGTLAEQTHWPVLELTLTEASGPSDFFSRSLGGSLSMLAWVGATAVIWVPLVVLLTLFWRRLNPRRPNE